MTWWSWPQQGPYYTTILSEVWLYTYVKINKCPPLGKYTLALTHLSSLFRVISSLNIFNQPGYSGAPGPEDWCSCQDAILGTNCYRTPYDRCDLTLSK